MSNATLLRPTHNKASVTYGSAHLKRPIIEGLIGYWRMESALFNGTANEVIDSSGNGNHGVAVNSATTIAAGKLGRAGGFDGISKYLSLSTGVGDFTDNFTLVAWVKTSTDAVQTIIAKNEVGTQQYLLQVGATATGRKVRFLWQGGSGLSTVGTIFDGEWHCVGVVIDGAASQIYIDGEPDGSTFTPSIISKPAVATTIGARNLGTTEPFNGSIDEIMMWNRPLDYLDNKYINNAKYGLALV